MPRSPEIDDRHPAFSDAVRAAQAERGSRKVYARVEARGRRANLMELVPFLAQTRSLYLATASADGQPYVQHRGGPPGFVKVLDPTRLGFADYAGNRQYISTGNLSENPKVQLFLMDYTRQQRIKLWGTAQMADGDAALMDALAVPTEAKPERAFVMEVTQWDANCPQHIPQRFEAADVAAALDARDARIKELETQIQVLEQKGWLREGCAGAGDFD